MTLKLWFSCSSLPKISYMKALDIYLAFCFCMVFGALLEYATVTYSGKRIKMNQAKLAEFQLLVEEMRADLGRKLKLEQQLVRIEDEARGHADGCPAKVTARLSKYHQLLEFSNNYLDADLDVHPHYSEKPSCSSFSILKVPTSASTQERSCL